MAKITYERVAAICETLQQKGIKPTNHTVRAENDNEGSYETISPYLKQWRASQEKDAVPTIPDKVEDEANKMIDKIWTLAYRIARAETDAIRDDYARKLNNAEDELQEMIKEADRLTAENNRLFKLNDNLKIERDNMVELHANVVGKLEVYERNDPNLKTEHDSKPFRHKTKTIERAIKEEDEAAKDIPAPESNQNAGIKNKEANLKKTGKKRLLFEQQHQKSDRQTSQPSSLHTILEEKLSSWQKWRALDFRK